MSIVWIITIAAVAFIIDYLEQKTKIIYRVNARLNRWEKRRRPESTKHGEKARG